VEIPDARSLSPEAQEALRARVVHAVVTEGKGITEAARTFGVHRGTASRWVNAYRGHGPGALAARARGRKPTPLLTPAQQGRLLDVLTHRTPDLVGLSDTLWTRDAVADWAARELGVRRSRWVWGRWLRAHNFTPQRPARRAYEQDPAAVARWLQEAYPRVEAEAKAEGAEIHWLDEAGVRSDGTAGRGYAPRGHTPVQPLPGQRFGINYIATVTSLGVLRFMVFGGRFTAAVLLVFLARLLAGRPGKVYVILDGHPSHRAKKVAAWVAARADRIRLVFLPPYSPELNPAEYLNNDVKANAQRDGRARDKGQLADKVRGYLRATQQVTGVVQGYFQAKHVSYAA
jgi:transposase